MGKRFLFAAKRPAARTAPIYLALLALALASTVGLASALWRGETAQPLQPPAGPMQSSRPPAQESATPAAHSKPRPKGLWM